MSAQATTISASEAVAILDQNKKRVEELTARLTQINVKVEAAKQQYAQLASEAVEQFGSAELPVLRDLLRAKTEENNTLVRQWLAAIDEAQAHVERIERALSDPAALEALLQALPGAAMEEAAPADDAQDAPRSAPADDEDL
jgi:hypothetical protein